MGTNVSDFRNPNPKKKSIQNLSLKQAVTVLMITGCHQLPCINPRACLNEMSDFIQRKKRGIQERKGVIQYISQKEAATSLLFSGCISQSGHESTISPHRTSTIIPPLPIYRPSRNERSTKSCGLPRFFLTRFPVSPNLIEPCPVGS